MEYYHSKYGRPRRKKRGLKKWLFILLILVVLAAGAMAYLFWLTFHKSNVWTTDDTSTSIYISTGAGFDDVKKELYQHGLIINRKTFEWLAKKKKYDQLVKPGRYLLYNGMSNLELINILRSGLQTPVKVMFNNLRTKEELAKKVSEQIEADSASIMDLMTDSLFLTDFSINPDHVEMMFIPNTYEFYWNTDARGFLERMSKEYNKFWNSSRKEKALRAGLDPWEVVTLASIVDKETNKTAEMPVIAGVYINRLNKNWRLQADPTVIYAVGDFSIRRVLKVHTEYESPYNTYLIQGLPPGPICISSIASIESVLNYDDHDYLYFCAKDDFSGYHAFAKTYRQHKKNAKKFQEALDRKNIKK